MGPLFSQCPGFSSRVIQLISSMDARKSHLLGLRAAGLRHGVSGSRLQGSGLGPSTCVLFPQDCRVLLSVEPTDQGCYPLNNRLFCKPCHVKRSAAGCC